MGMPVQSVVFNKRNWTKREATKWLKRHRYANNGVHETNNFYRYRQFDPDPNKEYRAVPIATKDILLILEL